MFEITVSQDFAAAHKLIGYDGECKNLHGHTWKVEVTICGTKLDNRGMIYDFRDLKKALHDILDKYDHTCLNDIEPFNDLNPTAENLSFIIFEQMKKSCQGCTIKKVKVWESPNSYATYYEE